MGRREVRTRTRKIGRGGGQDEGREPDGWLISTGQRRGQSLSGNAVEPAREDDGVMTKEVGVGEPAAKEVVERWARRS